MAMVELAPIRVDAERARAYVLAHGGPREVARVDGLFGATGPNRNVVKELESLQNADGGFPGGGAQGGPGSVDATCYILQQLKDMPPLAGSPMASRAVAFLRRTQQTDGSWRESGEAAEAPWAGPWAKPENAASGPYLTANAAYTILTLEPEHLDPVYRAAAWLRRAMAADAADLPTQTLGLAFGLYYRLHGPRSHEAAWSFTTAMKREMTADELAWFLTCALEVSAGGKFLVPVVQGLERLAAMQQDDGAWPAEPGLELESTLSALRVFRGYGIA
jgi:hypothetical protein